MRRKAMQANFDLHESMHRRFGLRLFGWSFMTGFLLAATMRHGPPPEFGKLVADETEKWRKVVEFAGASVD